MNKIGFGFLRLPQAEEKTIGAYELFIGTAAAKTKPHQIMRNGGHDFSS